MSSIGHNAQDYASGKGAVQIRYGLWSGSLVDGWVTASSLRVDEVGVPRDSESGERPPLLVLERSTAGVKIDRQGSCIERWTKLVLNF